MERSCAVARGEDINNAKGWTSVIQIHYLKFKTKKMSPFGFMRANIFAFGGLKTKKSGSGRALQNRE